MVTDPRVMARDCRKVSSLGMERAGRCGLAAARIEERSRASARAFLCAARAALAAVRSAPASTAPRASRKAVAQAMLTEAE